MLTINYYHVSIERLVCALVKTQLTQHPNAAACKVMCCYFDADVFGKCFPTANKRNEIAVYEKPRANEIEDQQLLRGEKMSFNCHETIPRIDQD